MLKLGILTDIAPSPAGPGVRWPEHTYFHVGPLGPELGCDAVIFTPNGIDWEQKIVRGWRYDRSERTWTCQTLPVPDVVYNRISRRKIESSAGVQKCLARLAALRPVFNPRFIEKWEVHESLVGTSVEEHLPWTTLVHRPEEVVRALSHHPDVFLKPRHGSLGEGMVRLRAGDERYAYEINGRGGKPATRGTASPAQLRHLLRRWCAPNQMMLQETIPRATWGGSPYDIRILVQRGDRDRFSLTGAAGRVAGTGEFTTHTVRGGRKVPLSQLLPAPSALEREAQLAELGVSAAAAVERRLGPGFFEFSLDVGVSRDGRLYLFEVNAKPFPFDEDAIRQEAAVRLVRYARLRARAELKETVHRS